MGVGSCIQCPSLCKTCDQNECLSCQWGELDSGMCLVPKTYKSQSIELNTLSTCNSLSMRLNPTGQNLKLPPIRNHQNNLYDEIRLSVTVYYDIDLTKAS